MKSRQLAAGSWQLAASEVLSKRQAAKTAADLTARETVAAAPRLFDSDVELVSQLLEVPGEELEREAKPISAAWVKEVVAALRALGLTVRPGYEVLDPHGHSHQFERARVAARAGDVVMRAAQQEFAGRDHPSQGTDDADDVDDRGDGEPGNLAHFAGGNVVAVGVGDVVVVLAADEVPPCGAVVGRGGVRAATGAQALLYWRKGDSRPCTIPALGRGGPRTKPGGWGFACGVAHRVWGVRLRSGCTYPYRPACRWSTGV